MRRSATLLIASPTHHQNGGSSAATILSSLVKHTQASIDRHFMHERQQ
jgi:hypothetical protein